MQEKAGKEILSGDQLAEVYKGFIKDYPVVSIEDPFDQVRFSPDAQSRTHLPIAPSG